MIGTGCNNSANNDKESSELETTNVSYKETTNVNVSEQIKQLLMKQKEVNNAIVVPYESELFIATEINQMDRFQLKEIEQRLTQMIEEEYPNQKVFLSVDKKIYLEIEKLEKQVNGSNMNKKKIKNELNKLKNLSKELT